MLFYLYNDHRESILYDINSKLRTDAIKCEKIKLTNISSFNLNKLNNNDLLILTGCCIPSSVHNFTTDCKKNYDKFLLAFNKKVILFEDIHDYTYGNYSRLFNDLENYNIKYGISMYYCDEWDYIKKNYNWNKTFILNHHYDSKTFYNMKLKKDIDILLYGDVNNHYPFRYKIKTILENMKGLNIHIVNRQGYFTNNLDSVIEHRTELSKLINRSHICISTCSKYNYFVCKYLEIIASNSICAGNIETIGRRIFQNNFIELSLNMSDNEIKQKLINALKDKYYLKEMNKNVKQFVSRFSIQNNYWDNLKNMIKNF